MTTENDEKIIETYRERVNYWCMTCGNTDDIEKCRGCFLPDDSDEGKIGRPSEFEEKSEGGYGSNEC